MSTHAKKAAILSIFITLSLAGTRAALPVPLAIAISNDVALVSWSGSGFVLQTATQLNFPSPWRNATQPVITEGPHTVGFSLKPAQSFYRLIYSPFLAPPTGLDVIPETDQFFVSWDSVTNATAYNLYLSLQPGVGPGHYDQAFNGITNVNAILTNLEAGVRYYFSVTATNDLGESASAEEVSASFGPEAEIEGSIYTLVQDGTNELQVFLPNVNVFLTNLSSGDFVAATSTDGEGRFTFLPQSVGNYQLCWSASHYLPGCSTQQVTIVDQPFPQTVYLAPEYIQPLLNPAGLVFGNVTFADGSLVEAHDPSFGIDVRPVLTLRGSDNHLAASVSPNAAGEYVAPGLAANTNYLLSADVEAAHFETNINTAVVGRVDIVFSNSPPSIQGVSAILDGAVVRRAPPGTVLSVAAQATDPDAGDTLHYTWFVGEETTNFSSVDSSNVVWTLPMCDGLFPIYVRVSDGKGGYATARTAVSTSPGLLFSGRVVGSDFQITTNLDLTLQTNLPPVTNALVSINGQSALTDEAGNFTLTLSNSAPDYVLCIGHPDYVSLSEVLPDETLNTTFQLQRAGQITTNYFGQDLDFTVENVQVHIPGGGLIASDAATIINPITAYITPLDPCSMPQLTTDNHAQAQGTNYLLQFLTAVDVHIQDAASNEIVLAPGASATLTVPANAGCIMDTNSLPPSSRAWHRVPCARDWTPIDNASLSFLGAQPFYGFTTLALGLVGAAAPVPPVNIILDYDSTVPPTFDVAISGKGFLVRRTIPEKGDDNTNKFEIPSNLDVKIQILSPREAPGDFYYEKGGTTTLKDPADKTVIIQRALNSGDEEQTVKLGLFLQLPDLKAARLKTGNFLTFKANNGVPQDQIVDEAKAYYKAIHAGTKTSLRQWQIDNGFVPAGSTNPPTDDASAVFFNASDLGFGRSMHMKKRLNPKDNKMDIAYYVSNHPTVAQAITGSNLIATVAMNYAYDPIYQKRYTKFYIFNDLMDLANFADLDGVVARPPPNLCIVCHGGKKFNFSVATGEFSPKDGDLGSQFIPFDPASYTYDGSRKQADLQASFDALNDGIKLTNPHASLVALIDGLKGNGFKTYVPNPGWSAPAPSALYQNVVAVSCRSCHATRANITLDTFAELQNLSQVAGPANLNKCYPLVAKNLVMPNALRTFSIFWGSAAANVIKPGVCPDQPNLLKQQFNWPNALAK